MRTVINSKLVRRNTQIAKYANPLMIVLLAGSMFVVLQMPERIELGMAAALLVFMTYPVSMRFMNLWGRRPRPDEIIERCLKGLDRQYTLYHYATPARHLLAGPAGLWVILPYYQAGRLIYEKGRFRLRGGGFTQSYLRVMGPESLGRPDLDAEADVAAVRRLLVRLLPEGVEPPPVRALLLFVHPRMELQAEGSPIPAVAARELKDFLRRRAREEPLPAGELDKIRAALPQPSREE
jgi:hypothetical protein